MTVATVKVVGMVAGERLHIVRYVDTRDPVLAVPEPTNEYDPNAVAIYTAPSHAMTDSHWRQDDGWQIGDADRRLLMDRQAGYVPRDLAARLNLPPEGIAGQVQTVRFHPDSGDPVGLDVIADWPLHGGGTTRRKMPTVDPAWDYG